METATPFTPLFIAVVKDNPADVYCIARLLQAHQVLLVLQVLERRQRILRFFGLLAREHIWCPALLLLDSPLPGVDTRALLRGLTALPVGQR
jgi:hypothetical protein